MRHPSAKLRLNGVHHTAFPTAKPKETIEFYRDVLELPVLHAITAKGWGWKGGYPDFFHFFFDAGNGSTIAFFFHIGSPPPERPADPLGYQAQARHTAWLVDSIEELEAWHRRLKSRGVKVTPHIRHELIESIYFLDPNNYPLEITRPLRELGESDRQDAELSLQAIAETFGANPEERTITGKTIEDMWRLKAAKVRASYAFDPAATRCPAIYVLNVPEYQPLISYARGAGLTVEPIGTEYLCVSGGSELVLSHRDIALDDALWFSVLVGGLCGDVVTYATDELRIIR